MSVGVGLGGMGLGGMGVGEGKWRCGGAEWVWGRRLTEVRTNRRIGRKSGESYNDGGGFPNFCGRVAKVSRGSYVTVTYKSCILYRDLRSRTFGNAGIFCKRILA